jgi:hypothetical protein
MSLIWNDIEEHASRCEGRLTRFQCLSGSSGADDQKPESEPESANYLGREPSYWKQRQWSAVSPFQTCASAE